MTDQDRDTLTQAAREHAAAVKVIAEALHYWFPVQLSLPSVRDGYARAILARLAAHDPPILVTMEQETTMPENIAYCHELLTDAEVPLNGPFAPLTLADRISYLTNVVETLRSANRQLRADVGGGETAIRYLEQQNEHLRRERDEALAKCAPTEEECVVYDYACKCGADSDPGACGHHPSCPALRRPLDHNELTPGGIDA